MWLKKESETEQGRKEKEGRGEKKRLAPEAPKVGPGVGLGPHDSGQGGASGHPQMSFGVRVAAGPRGFTLAIPLLGLAIVVRPGQGPRHRPRRGKTVELSS